MTLTSITLRNVLGIEQLEFRLGKWTRITGKNGSGKTSIMTALESLFSRGTDATLRRVGADKAEITADLQDGETTHRIRRSITGKGDYTSVEPGQGKSWLQTLTEATRLNPVAFLTSKPAARIEMLLKAASIAFPRPGLLDAVMPLIKQSPRGSELQQLIKLAADAAGNPFERLEAVRKTVFAWRTSVNRAYQENRATATRLSEALPSIDQTNQDIDAELQGARTYLESLGRSRYEEENAVRDWHDAEIRRIAAEREKRMAAVAGKYDQATIEARDRVSGLEAEQKRHLEMRKTRELYNEMAAAAERLDAESTGCTTALAKIDAIKASLLAELPIPGLVINDGEIYLNEVPFDRLNTQQQMDLAITIAEKLPAQLDLCLIDGFERFDSEHQRLFEERSRTSPLQFVTASVSDGDLRVEEAA